MDKKRIEAMNAELQRLILERPALQTEMKCVFGVIDSAPHITLDLREQIHKLYNNRLMRVESDISDISANIAKSVAIPSDVKT